MKRTVIYSILNSITNEIYIGSAIDYITRWRNHKNLLLSNKHYNIKLQNSWNFYGKDNFIFNIIEHVSEENLIIREQYYLDIKLFASENDNRFYQLGFNTLRKAENSLGYKHTKEAIEKMSGKNNPMYGKSVWNGRQHKEESKELISKTKKGKSLKKDNHFYGKTHTEESKKKMRKNRKKLIGVNNPNYGRKSKDRRIVLQFDKNNNFIREWSHAGEASEKLCITREGIGACCLGRQKTHKGFIWKYKEDKKDNSNLYEEIKKLYNETNISQRELCKLYKMSPNTISKLLKAD